MDTLNRNKVDDDEYEYGTPLMIDLPNIRYTIFVNNPISLGMVPVR